MLQTVAWRNIRQDLLEVSSKKKECDYEETFAPVARYTSIRSVLALAAVMKWKIHQMDIKTAFLNGVVEEEVYA